MKIIFVTQYNLFDPSAGGPVFKLRALSNYLTELGHNITVITVETDIDVSSVQGEFLSELNNKVRIVSLKTIWKHRSITFNPGIFVTAWKEVKSADVIHVFGLYDLLGPIVALIAKIRKVPYLVEPLGMFLPIMRNLFMKKIYSVVLGNRLMSNAACLIATSNQERNELMSSGKRFSLIRVRRNGIDLNEFAKLPEYGLMRNQYGILPNEIMLLFLSRLSPKKNPELLIRAFAELNRSNVKLVFAGPDEEGYSEKLFCLSEKLGIEDDVIFTGPLFGNDKISAMYDADMFILPSVNENFGNVVAESVALGTPVIITNKCGIAPFISNKVGLVISPNKLDLIQGITNLLDDKELYLRFKESCNNVAHDLSWDVPVRELETIYKCVTNV